VDTLTETFEERLQEIEEYLNLLDALERQVREGPPKIGGSPITAQQQKILYSSVYLQLYNLVEATVTWCVEAVTAAAADSGRWLPTDLSVELRREWIRYQARTHVDLNVDNRLETAIKFFDYVAAASPILEWSVEKGGGGNWDDHEIEDISIRLGCRLEISAEVLKAAKREIRDEKNALELVKDFRNKLAHGNLSFTECGDGVTVGDLRDIKNRTATYLRAIVFAFCAYIERYEFLVPTRRPAPAGT
jgi:MAE_28990/MAE_18760-like HEPN